MTSVVLTEAAIVTVFALATSLLLGYWCVAYAKSLIPDTVFRVADIAINGRVLFASSSVLVASVALGILLPTRRMMRSGTFRFLRNHYSNRAALSDQRLRSGLVVAQTALSVTLMVGAALFTQSFLRLRQVDLGFDYDRTTAIRIAAGAPTHTGLGAEEAQRHAAQLVRDALDRAKAIPTVESAALIDGLTGGVGASRGGAGNLGQRWRDAED